jgi:GalNAc-alpha-(1->4)-GalNAc-alpha-(1->3)-diNAcBac-PP-undecaprenol alpha-1,4-N-acetyl-D-galactosaminyltransferase
VAEAIINGKKIIICLVIPSLQAGGMERVMSELACHFATKKEAEVHLILYGISREIFYSIPDNIIIHKPSFRFNNRYRLFYTLKTLISLRNTIKKINPDSILSFGEYWNNFLLLSIIGLKYPAFVSDRSQPDKSLGWFHDKLRHQLYPRANGLIFQTKKAKEIFLSKNKHPNVTVIGNPIKQFNTEKGHLKKEKNVLMVGRLIKTKHQDKLIEMFANVSPPGWKLIIVGYDHLKQHNMGRLQELAKDLNIEQKVIFTGKQDNIEEIYFNSSIFAFTSSSEGFPNVIGEAMAAGLPVISFDCVAGPSEMITDGYNGYLIPLFDYVQFESKLAQLMDDENLRQRFGSNGRESISKFSGEKICESFYKFITV